MTVPNFTRHVAPLACKDLFFLIVLLTLVFLRSDVIMDDMSLGWHLLTGNYILDHKAIPHTDIISYTRAGKPWLPYEWLSDLLMAAIVRLAGLPGLVVATATLIASTWMLLYERCNRVKKDFSAMAFLLTLLGARVAFGLWSARPYMFTYPLVLILVSNLERFRKRELSFHKMCLVVSVTIVLWTNLHPSFGLALGIIAVYLMCSLINDIRRYLQKDQLKNDRGKNPKDALNGSGKDASKTKQLAVLFVVGALSTLINPFGYGLHGYILGLSSNWLQQARLIGESEVYPIFVTGGITCAGFLIIVATGIWALIFTRGKVELCQVILFLILGYVSFTMAREVSIFVLVTLPFIAEWLAGVPESVVSHPALQFPALTSWWRRLNRDSDPSGSRRSHIPLILTSTLMLVALIQNNTHALKLIKADFNSEKLPTATARYIRENHLADGEGFSMYAWGGYLRWVYGIHVYIDDSNEFFDLAAYQNYLGVVNASPGWEQTLKDNHIAWVLCDKQYRLARVLANKQDWVLKCEDAPAALFVRR